MARKVEVVTITSPGRDAGKSFRITEKSADDAERWAHRALLALSRGGFEVPPGLFDAGMAGVAAIVPYLLVIGFRALHAAKWEELEVLLDEMLLCVKYIGPPGTPDQDIIVGVNSQIEEVRTRVELRKAVLMLHVSPFDIASFQTTERGDTQGSLDLSPTGTSPQS